jgi:two-component system, chemotaxis family, sensor kinase CheA
MDDEQKYLKIFISEAIDILQAVSDDLLRLEETPDNQDILNRLFRSLHTLKGGASLDGLDKISNLSHLLEDIFGVLREGQTLAKPDYIDIFFEATDKLDRLVNSIGGDYDCIDISDMVPKLEKVRDDILSMEQKSTTIPGNGMNITPEQLDQLIHNSGNVYKVTCRFDPKEPMVNINAFVILNNLKPISSFIKSNPDENHMKTDSFDKCEILLKTDSAQYIVENKIVANCKNFSIDHIGKSDLGRMIETPHHTEEFESFIDKVINEHSTRFIEEIETGSDAWLIELNFMEGNPMKGVMAYIIYNNLLANSSHIVSSIQPEEFKHRTDFQKVLIYTATKDIDKERIEGIIKTNCTDYNVKELSNEDFAQQPPIQKEAEPEQFVQYQPLAYTGQDDKQPAYMEVDKAIVDQVIENIGEVFINLNYLVQVYNSLVESDINDIEVLKKENEQASNQLNATAVLLNSLMDYAVLLRMVPVKKVFKKFPRIVRDISRKLGKKVLLVIEGERSRIDQEMLEALEAPILHMIRNSMDHGIESPEERKRLGKDPRGTITLRAKQLKSTVEIEIIDDGKGMDKDKILNKAINKGLIEEEKTKDLSNEEIYAFIYHPGFSTSEEVSQISGRGVGMDVVATEVKKVGGKIKITSEKGKGTKITLELPITI